MPATASFKDYVNQYRFDIDGVSFWSPYWRDTVPTVDNPIPPTGPYKGKGTPQQIQDELLEHLGERRFTTGKEYRQYMYEQLHLGVECSGLIYYVLDSYLKDNFDTELKNQLFKPRSALLADFANPVYTHPAHITKELLEAQPEQVSLAKIQEFWGNQPVRLAGVGILASSAANRCFSDVDQLQPGDTIYMMGHDNIAHLLIVTAASPAAIEYAHSGGTHDRPGHYGGIQLGRIVITDASLPIEQQQWEGEGQHILDTHTFDTQALRRLNILDHA